MRSNTEQSPNTLRQLTIKLSGQPGRPPVSASQRRQIRSITLAPGVISEFTLWTDKNDLSFSRGVEKAIDALMKGTPSGTDI